MRIFAVFGDPVEHSISPRLHNNAITALGLDAVYSRYRLTDGSRLAAKFRGDLGGLDAQILR